MGSSEAAKPAPDDGKSEPPMAFGVYGKRGGELYTGSSWCKADECARLHGVAVIPLYRHPDRAVAAAIAGLPDVAATVEPSGVDVGQLRREIAGWDGEFRFIPSFTDDNGGPLVRNEVKYDDAIWFVPGDVEWDGHYPEDDCSIISDSLDPEVAQHLAALLNAPRTMLAEIDRLRADLASASARLATQAASIEHYQAHVTKLRDLAIEGWAYAPEWARAKWLDESDPDEAVVIEAVKP